MVVHMDARSEELLNLKRENAKLRARVEELEKHWEQGTGLEASRQRREVVGREHRVSAHE